MYLAPKAAGARSVVPSEEVGGLGSLCAGVQWEMSRSLVGEQLLPSHSVKAAGGAHPCAPVTMPSPVTVRPRGPGSAVRGLPPDL